MAASSTMARILSLGLAIVRGGGATLTTLCSSPEFPTPSRSTSVPQKFEPIRSGVSDGGLCPHGRVTPVIHVLSHDGNAIREGDLRLPPQMLADFRDVGPRAV